MLQLGNRRDVTIINGVSESGKTTFALRYLVNADLALRFVFDVDGQLAGRLGLEPATDAYSLSLCLCQGWVVFNPHVLFAGRVTEAFRFFCEWSYEASLMLPGKKVLLVDEVWRYQSPQGIPQELQNVCQSGRTRGLALMVCTQQPHRINGSLLNEVSEMVCFRLQYKGALDAVSKDYGFEREEVQSLPMLQFVSRNLESGGELRGKIIL